MPSDKLRKLEIEVNAAFEAYRDAYVHLFVFELRPLLVYYFFMSSSVEVELQ